MYMEWARGILDHGRFGVEAPTAYTVPGYSAFLALLMAASRSVVWLQAANLGLAVLTAWLLAMVAGRLFPDSRRAPVAAALVYALYPPFIFYAPLLFTENLFTPMVLLILLAALSRLSGGWAAVLCGLLLGAAMLTRAEAGVYAPALFFVFLLDRAQAGESLSLKVVAALLLTVVTVATISPWLMRNRAVMGMGMSLSNGGGLSLYLGNNPHGYNNVNDTPGLPHSLGEVERNRRAAEIAVNYLSENPGVIPGLVAKKTWHLLRPTRMPVYWSTRGAPTPGQAGYPDKPLAGRRVFEWVSAGGWALLALVTLAALVGAGKWPSRTRWLLGGMAVATWLMYGVIFVAIARYRYFLEVLCCLAAAAGIDAWIKAWHRRRIPLQGVREADQS